MKAKIHPKYVECKVTCACGESFTTRSTRSEIRIEICSKCHPFYTGKQKYVDTAGRVEKFQRRYNWGKDISPDSLLEKSKKRRSSSGDGKKGNGAKASSAEGGEG